MYIVDARVRPPISMFKDSALYSRSDLPGMLSRKQRYGLDDPAFHARSVPLLLAQMHAAGVAHAVVPGRASNPMLGGGKSESLVELVRANPQTFSGLAGIDPTDVHNPAALIDAIHAAGFRGATLEPGTWTEHPYLDAIELFPTYEALQAAKLVLYVLAGGSAGPDITYSNPERVDRVAINFPELQLVIVHAGFPYVQQACGVVYRRKNVWLLPDMYFPGFPGESDYLIAASSFAQDRFLFGSAYPLCPLDQHLQRFLELPLSDAIKEKIVGKNAARLFSLTVANSRSVEG